MFEPTSRRWRTTVISPPMAETSAHTFVFPAAVACSAQTPAANASSNRASVMAFMQPPFYSCPHARLHQLALQEQEPDEERGRGHERRRGDHRPVDALVSG